MRGQGVAEVRRPGPQLQLSATTIRAVSMVVQLER